MNNHLELRATILFVGAALAMATVCGAIIISGWFAGVIQDEYERIFWAGAILGGIAVTLLGVAAIPGGSTGRVLWCMRIGLVALLVAPALLILAMALDFYR